MILINTFRSLPGLVVDKIITQIIMESNLTELLKKVIVIRKINTLIHFKYSFAVFL